ncbi:MAG: polymerase, sigma-24 subunit, subfamily [Hyphomicrobiales bacterium]|nr:polymerase, sigma-24 subunit, subfamily [Hyphomicrobiales bacterium]
MTGNSSDAQDVVQDACLRVLQGIHGYKGGNPRAWLLTITRNAALTFLAGKRRRGGTVSCDAAEAERIEDPAATPEAHVIAQADSATLEAALAALPQRFREILILREYEGLSYREIARLTGVPAGTVMSRLARARALLPALLLAEKMADAGALRQGRATSRPP